MNNNSAVALGLLFLLGLAGVAVMAIAISRQQGTTAFAVTPTVEDLPVASIVNEPAETVRYENIEEIELLDIDKDLLMPRKIIVHRKSKELR